MKFDLDLTKQDIQGLSNADAVAGLFQRLAYNIDKRVEQTTSTMGIAADGTQRPIKRIELIADQDTLLQVYLFEVSSVTVTHTRALARSLRNRSVTTRFTEKMTRKPPRNANDVTSIPAMRRFSLLFHLSGKYALLKQFHGKCNARRL